MTALGAYRTHYIYVLPGREDIYAPCIVLVRVGVLPYLPLRSDIGM